MHFGVPEHGVFPLVSMLGDLVPVTVGAALAFKRRQQAARRADVLRRRRLQLRRHARGPQPGRRAERAGGVHRPVEPRRVLDRQREGDAQPEPVASASRAATRSRAPGSTAPTRSPSTAPCGAAAQRARSGEGPQAVEALSLRIDGHAAHDDGRYMDRALIEEFVTQRDPVERLAARMLADGTAGRRAADLREAAVAEVAAGLAEAETAPAARSGDAARRRLRDAAPRRPALSATVPGAARRRPDSSSRRRPRRPVPRSRASRGSSIGSPPAPGTRERDAAGNLVWRLGDGPPALALLAHVDTVFAADVDLSVDEPDGWLHGAGIGDNAAAVAVAVDVVEALAAELTRPLAVVFTVGEEGLGNLRGALHACGELRPEMAIALEGHGLDEVCVDAVGSVRARLARARPGRPLVVGSRPAERAAHAGLAADGAARGGLGRRRRSTSAASPAAAPSTPSRPTPRRRSRRGRWTRRRWTRSRPSLADLRLPAPLELTVEPLGRRPAGRLDRAHPLLAAVREARAEIGPARRAGRRLDRRQRGARPRHPGAVDRLRPRPRHARAVRAHRARVAGARRLRSSKACCAAFSSSAGFAR